MLGYMAVLLCSWSIVFAEGGEEPTEPPDTPPSAPCSVNEDDLTNSSTSIGDMLRPCRPTGVITTDNTDSKDFKINGGARERVIALANQIILAGSLLAVGAIVYAAILYTIAAGDDEKIKKAKGSLKFGIIGFLMMLISFPLVNAIIKLFYTASS